jgi:AcrR family transcriptional regulator
VQEGFRPPQQARSRASLEKVLAAAEHVRRGRRTGGLSVGAIYRRFAGKDQLLFAVKDQLLSRLETSVDEALRDSAPGLRAVVGAFTRALAGTFAAHDRIFSELLDGQRADGRERGLRALAGIQQAFVEAAGDGQAVRTAARTVIGACVHRAATCRYWPDDLDWTTWAAETTEMALAYLALAK